MFRFEAKITKSKRSKKFKALLPFEAIITQVIEVKNLKRKKAKRSEKREMKFYSEIVKQIQIRFILLKSENIFKRNGLTLLSAETPCWEIERK